MRVKFIKETKDTREGSTSSFKAGWSGVMDNNMAKAYIKEGSAVEIGINLETGEDIDKVVKKK